MRANIDLKKLIRQIDLCLVTLINQITFCRSVLLSFLLKVKVSDVLISGSENESPELRAMFYHIQNLKKRNLIQYLNHVDRKYIQAARLNIFAHYQFLHKYFFGRDSD